MSEAGENQREVMDVDVVIVGGGVAGLSAALRISQLLEQSPLGHEPTIAVLEKASEIGAHSLSGAVLNTKALEELIPDYAARGCPIDCKVEKDAVYYFTENSAIRSPVTPPPFHNVGHSLISISQFNRWLGTQCEEKGIMILPSFAAVEALYEGEKIVGIRTGDKGLDKNGQPKSNFEPGMILKAKFVIFAEGTRGSLFKRVSQKLDLRAGKNPEVFEEGVKEIIQMPPGNVEPGHVIHTLGYPLSESIGGTFIYTLKNDRIAVGLVTYLDSHDPLLDPHRELQKLKTHPFMRKLLKGGKVIAYGGKTLPAGGYYSMPKLYGDGWVVTGDSASFVDVQKLKGIHLAMKSGMLAAETAVTALRTQDSSEAVTAKYDEQIRASYVGGELHRVRNFHQALSKGVLESLPLIALQEVTGGRGLQDPMPAHPDTFQAEPVIDVWGPDPFERQENQIPRPDGILFFDKLSSVYLTGTSHDENSPNHLLLRNGDTCRTTCEPKFKSPCTHFCPAQVYEMEASAAHPGQMELKINYTNCIHCKTCDIKCPFENIDWTVPEGGGGPKYTET